jgi:hypothetical protein
LLAPVIGCLPLALLVHATINGACSNPWTDRGNLKD